MKPWTEEEKATALEMRGEYSATLIGEKLGRKKGSVLGFFHRLGLPKIGAPKVSKPPMEGGNPANQTVTHREKRPGQGEIAMRDLTPDGCRWPYDAPKGYTFCGDTAVEGRSYCQYHLNRAHSKKRKRKPNIFVLPRSNAYGRM